MEVELEKLKKSCRLCLAYEQEVSLFSEYRCQLEFHEIASSFAKIEINKNDHLPKKICTECASKLIIFYKFKQKCESSYNTLNALLDEVEEVEESAYKDVLLEQRVEEQSNVIYCYTIPSSEIEEIKEIETKNVEEIKEKDKPNIKISINQEKPESEINDHVTAMITDPFCRNDAVFRKKSAAKKLICELCGFAFAQISTLNQHYITHKDTKDFSCGLCLKTFTRKTHLKIHLRMHYNIKPYVCSICERSFTKSGDLSRHLRIHNDTKNYECSVCNKRFKRSTDVRTHMNTHTGYRPYRCTDVNCGKAFTSHTSLKNHKKTHITT